jgi:predicted O-methyltransferase YrrM
MVLPSTILPYITIPRQMIRFVKLKMGSKPLRGVEIGVANGENAESMLKTLNIEKLFLVDPYQQHYVQETRAHPLVIEVPMITYETAKKRLEPFKDNIVFLVKTSDEAAKEIPDELDFVYIDGNHGYEYVKRDLENYYPKVKVGGIIGGHDFFLTFFEGLVKAVVEFTLKHDLRLQGEHVDWWIVKTKEV